MGSPWMPESLARLTMTPEPRAVMWRSAARHMKYTPLRFVPIRRSYSSSVISVVGFSIQMPAELTRMSRRPKRATASATMRSQSATTETSPSTTACRGSWPPQPERSEASAATAAARASSLPPTATLTPSSASRYTIASPRPEEPPVTRAVLPSSPRIAASYCAA